MIRDEQGQRQQKDVAEPTENGDTDGNSSSPTRQNPTAARDASEDDDDDDYDKKSENAVDYSDINELAEDLQTLMAVSEIHDML